MPYDEFFVSKFSFPAFFVFFQGKQQQIAVPGWLFTAEKAESFHLYLICPKMTIFMWLNVSPRMRGYLSNLITYSVWSSVVGHVRTSQIGVLNPSNVAFYSLVHDGTCL